MNQLSKLREAKLFFASGQLRKSIHSFNDAEAEGGNLLDICISRGAAQMARGHFSDAENDFSRVLQDDADNERAYYFRGIAHAAQKKYSEAIEDFTQSLLRNKKRGIAHILRGMAYLELGNEGDAQLDFNSGSAFSEAEIKSFKALFGDNSNLFENTRNLLSRDNAPWNNIMTKDSAYRIGQLFR